MLSLLFYAVAVQAAEFRIMNHLPSTSWIGIQGAGSHENLEEGGFELAPNSQKWIEAPMNWTGIIWARTRCDPHTNICQTGSCGRTVKCSASPAPPVTIVDIALNPRGLDAYGVSLIDGFNVPAKIEPVSTNSGNCMPSSCLFDINSICEEELVVMGGSDGEPIGCHSSCSRYSSHFCRKNNTPIKSYTDIQWPVDSTPYFKRHCPEAKDYEITKLNKEFLCNSEAYTISFGSRYSTDSH